MADNRPSWHGHCRACAAPVLFARDESGQRIALEPTPRKTIGLLLVTTENNKLVALRKRWTPRRGIGYHYDGVGEIAPGLYVPHLTWTLAIQERKG